MYFSDLTIECSHVSESKQVNYLDGLKNKLSYLKQFPETAILTIEEQTLLNQYYSEESKITNGGKRWKLLYQGSRDGFSGRTFHKRCDYYDGTYTIIKDTENNVFGGYTDFDWNIKNKGNYKTDGKYNVTTLDGLTPLGIHFLYSLRKIKAPNNPTKITHTNTLPIIAAINIPTRKKWRTALPPHWAGIAVGFTIALLTLDAEKHNWWNYLSRGILGYISGMFILSNTRVCKHTNRGATTTWKNNGPSFGYCGFDLSIRSYCNVGKNVSALGVYYHAPKINYSFTGDKKGEFIVKEIEVYAKMEVCKKRK